MSTLAPIAAILVVAFFGYKRLDASSFKQAQIDRCNLLFENMKSGDISHTQEAATLWFIGTTGTQGGDALSAFEGWMRERGLAMGRVKSAKCSSATLVDGAERSAIVECVVDDKPLRLRCKTRSQITWE